MHNTLYVSDLDGTLLNGSSQVSENSARLLNNLIDSGAMFTVATARTPATVIPLLKEVNLKLPVVVMTGAAIWDEYHHRYKEIAVIDSEKVGRMCEIFAEGGVNPFIYTKQGESLVVYHAAGVSSEEQRFISERSESTHKKFVLEDNFNVGDKESLLVFAICAHNILHDIYERIVNEIECDAVCYRDISVEERWVLEVYAKGTSKAAAISRLAKSLDAGRIVVFGDNLNDIPMMRIADHSVAMSNAVNEVKEFADEVIGSNENDSVARWIAKDYMQ